MIMLIIDIIKIIVGLGLLASDINLISSNINDEG